MKALLMSTFSQIIHYYSYPLPLITKTVAHILKCKQFQAKFISLLTAVSVTGFLRAISFPYIGYGFKEFYKKRCKMRNPLLRSIRLTIPLQNYCAIASMYR